MEAYLPIESLEPGYLAGVCFEVGRTADQLGQLVSTVHGGSVTFDEGRHRGGRLINADATGQLMRGVRGANMVLAAKAWRRPVIVAEGFAAIRRGAGPVDQAALSPSTSQLGGDAQIGQGWLAAAWRAGGHRYYSSSSAAAMDGLGLALGRTLSTRSRLMRLKLPVRRAPYRAARTGVRVWA